MIGRFSLILILGVVPIILGIPWTKIVRPKYTIAFSYIVGFFIELSVFHIIVFPATILYVSFRTVVIVYSIALLLLTAGSVVYSIENGLIRSIISVRKIKPLNWLEYILIITFLGTLAIQLVRGFTYDITYMSYDDSLYTTEAVDALEVDGAGIVNSFTGIGGISPNIQRAIQTSLVFPAYLTAVSGITVATMEHTIQYTQFIILSYMANAYLAGELFKKRENILAFMLFVSVFYIFGYHSHYSLTFRMLGPNYQGKAILAVSLTPLILAILLQALGRKYEWKIGLLLAILSLSAVSLTLWGIGTIAVIISMPVVLSMFRKEREWKHILYIVWGNLLPVSFLTLYMLNK